MLASAAGDKRVAGALTANALASAYVSALRDVGARLPACAKEIGLAREFRTRLMRLLASDEPVDALSLLEALWSVAPAPAFADERVLLFEKLGRHADALAVIVGDLDDFDAAESYCARVDARDPSTQVYSKLLHVSSGSNFVSAPKVPENEPSFSTVDGARFLRPRGGNVDTAPFLMATSASLKLSDDAMSAAVARAAFVHLRSCSTQSSIDSIVALPSKTPLRAIAQLLEKVSRVSCDAIAAASAARAVAQVTRARVLAEAVTRETRGIQIDKASACAVCKRRVGAMQPSTAGGLSLRPLPFQVSPNGSVCHSTCIDAGPSGSSSTAPADRA
jgi:hypothetical protein